MSIIEEVELIGVRAAERKPLRALVLALLSRAMIGLLIIAVAWAVITVRSASAGAGIEGRPFAVVEPVAVAPTGTSIGAMLDDVRVKVAGQGGSLIDLELARRSGVAAPVRLTLELNEASAPAVDRLIASLAQGGMIDPTPRSVDPVPSGLRVRIDASVELASASPVDPGPVGGAVALILADAAERAGVELRGVEVPERPQEPVRLATSGELAALVRLIHIVEEEHSAPLLFRDVSVRRLPSGDHDMTLVFGLREDVVRAAEPRS